MSAATIRERLARHRWMCSTVTLGTWRVLTRCSCGWTQERTMTRDEWNATRNTWEFAHGMHEQHVANLLAAA